MKGCPVVQVSLFQLYHILTVLVLVYNYGTPQHFAPTSLALS